MRGPLRSTILAIMACWWGTFASLCLASPLTSELLKDIERGANNSEELTIVSLLESFPSEALESLSLATLVQKSGAPFQMATSEKPRAILFDKEAKAIMTFSAHEKEGELPSLEFAIFNEDTKQYEGFAMVLQAGKVNLKGPNPEACMRCHAGGDLGFVPLWDDYSQWKNVVGMDDDNIRTSEQEKLADLMRKSEELDDYKVYSFLKPVFGEEAEKIYRSRASAHNMAENPEVASLYESSRPNAFLTKGIGENFIRSIMHQSEASLKELPLYDIALYAWVSSDCKADFVSSQQRAAVDDLSFAKQCHSHARVLRSTLESGSTLEQSPEDMSPGQIYPGRKLLPEIVETHRSLRKKLTGLSSYSSWLFPSASIEDSPFYEFGGQPANTLEAALALEALKLRGYDVEAQHEHEYQKLECPKIYDLLVSECAKGISFRDENSKAPSHEMQGEASSESRAAY